MKFTDTQFVKAIELIQASNAKKNGNDNRRAARTEIRIPVAVKFESDEKTDWITASLHDISARGTKLETNVALEIGSSFLLRLPTKDGDKDPEPLICRVAHCEPRKKNSFLIGAEFVGRLTAGKSAGQNAADLDRIQHSILD